MAEDLTEKLAPGRRAPDFELPGVAGGTVRLYEHLPKAKATVVTFICNHCPYVVAYVPRLVELQREFAPQEGQVIAICSNDAVTYPDDSFDNMKVMAERWGLNFPYLRDEDQSVARAYGAERTPEVFLLDAEGVCRYEGGIDDNYQDPDAVTERPLRDAIVAVAGGEPVAQPTTYAIGCTIKWKR